MSFSKAFTMIELVFVIVTLGILTAVAIPKMGAFIEDAALSKGAETVASIRNSVMVERQKRLMQGQSNFTPILDDAAANQAGEKLFDGNATYELFTYPLLSGTDTGNWMKRSSTQYRYYRTKGQYIDFNYTSATGVFDCDHSDDYCNYLTK